MKKSGGRKFFLEGPLWATMQEKMKKLWRGHYVKCKTKDFQKNLGAPCHPQFPPPADWWSHPINDSTQRLRISIEPHISKFEVGKISTLGLDQSVSAKVHFGSSDQNPHCCKFWSPTGEGRTWEIPRPKSPLGDLQTKYDKIQILNKTYP